MNTCKVRGSSGGFVSPHSLKILQRLIAFTKYLKQLSQFFTVTAQDAHFSACGFDLFWLCHLGIEVLVHFCTSFYAKG